MTDRVLVYTGALPQTSDILQTNKFGMFGLGYGMQAVLGTSTYVDGLACTPTTPTPDLHVTVGVGSIYTLTQVDATSYSDLGTDTTSIVKQGLYKTATQFTITPPGTAGQSQVFLVQAIYNDADSGATVLSYYNASNPSAPFSGPANAGTSNYTVRQGNCVVALKAGVAAPTGSQVTPSPDAGYVGLYAVTVANGQTQITSSNIVTLTTAPFISTKLPQVPSGVQSGQWLYAADTSANGAAVATSAQTLNTSAVLTFTSVPSYVAAGMVVADLTTPSAITGGQTVLSKTATTVTLSANVNATVNSGDQIAFSTNALIASVSPVPASLTPGMEVRIKSAGTISGAATLNLNSLGATAIHRANGSNTAAGDIMASEVVALVYDGAAFQIKNYLGISGTTNNNTYTIGVPYGADTSTSSNTITVSPTPAITSPAAGQPLVVKLANPITGSTAITVGTNPSAPVVNQQGQALTYGAGSQGEMLWMLYDGANWQIINPTNKLVQNLTIYVNPTTGSDSYDGSQATVSGTKGPLQHIQTAVNKAFGYPPSQYTITIQCADGTYNESVLTPTLPGPAVIINGDAGAPSNVLVSGATNSHCFEVVGPNTLTVQNLKVQTATGGNLPPAGFVAAGSGASLTTNNTVSGAVTGAVHEAYGGATVYVGNHTYAGNATYALLGMINGTVLINANASFTISTPITVSSWAYAYQGAAITVPPGIPTFTNPGNVTGSKYSAAVNGTITSYGQGVNYFPGNSAGTTSTGGQYL